MAPILGKQLSLLDSDVAFLGKALDGEDVTVIDARTRCSVKAELLAMLDSASAKFRAALAAAENDALMTPWSLLGGGVTMFTMPRVAVLRSMIFNHIVHHRGQLSVYLRMCDIPVPAMYGPSADEAN